MKLLILLLLVTSIAFSQKKEIIITKKGGSEIIAKRYNSKFKHLKIVDFKGNSFDLPYKDIGKVEYEIKVKRKIKKITKHFIRISNRNGMLMELIVPGSCRLYSSQVGSHGGGSGSSYSEFYAIREGEDIATRIGSDALVDQSYKKIALDYFEDCKKAVNKIKEKFKRKKISELVKFYNENCL